MTYTGRSQDVLADDWLTAGTTQTAQHQPGAKAYPKRSELRRAEARAASRRGAERRPPGSRPSGGAPGRSGPPGPAVSARGADLGRRQVVQPSGDPWLPIAVAPTAAALPIRQTSTQARPSGIDLQVRSTIAPDAFHQAPSPYAPVPIAVPAHDGRTADLAAPVVPAFDPADWGLDVDPAATTGRRRGAAAELHLDPRRPQSPPSLSLPVRLFGKGKSGAARLLVLALVVGAEGVAVSSMAGHARTAPVDPSTDNIAGAYQFTSVAAQSKNKAAQEAQAQQQAVAVAEHQQALAVAQAQTSSSKAKVTAALQQAQAAADRIERAAQRRDEAMRNAQRDPRSVGRIMAAERGWGADQFSCLNKLWNRESQWKYNADNPSSSAYGIPQALPGNKMATAGADWRTNPVTQIKWGLDYIADRYTTPCGAWAHSEAVGSY